jgi:tetratricopeptide (TPR) repeat protein
VQKMLLKIAVITLGSFLGLILIASAIYVYRYYPRTAPAFEIKSPHPAKKNLIASQSSDLKDTLVHALCDSLANSPVFIKCINLHDLPDMNSADWERVLILNTFMVRLNKHIQFFSNQNSAAEKTLLFVTSGGADWQPLNDLMVDAITFTSRKKYIDNYTRLIIDWLYKEDGEKWCPKDQLLGLLLYPRVDVNAACESISQDQVHYKLLYPNLSSSLNQIGYRRLRMNDLESAIKIFKLNVNLFPGFWNAYDSYGEALLKSGDMTAAKNNFIKASSEIQTASLPKIG